MARGVLTALSLSLACGATIEREPPTFVTPAASSGTQPERVARIERQPERAAPSRCRLPPAVASVESVSPAMLTSCAAPPRTLATRVRKEVSEVFEPTLIGGRAEVSFGCDGLAPRIQEIMLLDSDPYDLELWRASLDRDGESYEVRGVRYDRFGFEVPPNPNKPVFKLGRGRVARLPIEEALLEARVELRAELREQAPPKAEPVPGPRTVRMCGTSATRILVLVDDAGRRLVVRSDDVAGRVSDERARGFDLAVESLAAMKSAAPLAYETPDESDHGLFDAAIHLAAEGFDREVAARRQYTGLARFLGSPAIVPELLAGARALDADDHLDRALEALARTSGWDARIGDDGARLDRERARAAFLEGCK